MHSGQQPGDHPHLAGLRVTRAEGGPSPEVPGPHALFRDLRLKGWLSPIEAELPKRKEVQAGGQSPAFVPSGRWRLQGHGEDSAGVPGTESACRAFSWTPTQPGECETGPEPYGGHKAGGPWGKKRPSPQPNLSYSHGCWIPGDPTPSRTPVAPRKANLPETWRLPTSTCLPVTLCPQEVSCPRPASPLTPRSIPEGKPVPFS